MPAESWHRARLIPTSGISGAQEQERRATSALLAVLGSVDEFGRAMLRPFGAPAGKLECYIEVEFDLDSRKLVPDGLVRATRGTRSWTALIEVKTGRNTLDSEQLARYLDLAKREKFDALITISNEVPSVAGQHPTKVDKRKLRTVNLYHISWSRLLSEAVMVKEHRGVADVDQAWILGELIRYLEHPKSGALEFADMGGAWISTRQAVARGTLRQSDKGVMDVASRWDALLRYTSLKLGSKLGEEVSPILSKREREDPATRTQNTVTGLVSDGTLQGAIRIPNAIAPVVVTADLRAQVVTCHVDVEAPRTGRPKTRVSWLVRQLSKAPENVRLEAFTVRSRGQGLTELLRDVREAPEKLVADPAREIRSFRIEVSRPIGKKQGRGPGTFIDSVIDQVFDFYAEIVQDLKPWRTPPPRMREPVKPTGEDSSHALSSQDKIEESGAVVA